MKRAKSLVATALFAASALCAPRAWAVKCLKDLGDAGQVAAARVAIDSACPCLGTAGLAAHKSCVAGVLATRVGAVQLRAECASTVKKIYADSVCGQDAPNALRGGPHLPCVTTNLKTGSVSCSARPENKCRPDGNNTRSMCWASLSCLEAADANGDQQVSSPGDTETCLPVGGVFTDNGDGTISDSRTGLTWEKLSDDDGIHDKDNQYSWTDATAVKIAGLNAGGGFAGHTDWRLPTVHELFTLTRPKMPPSGFTQDADIPAEFDTGCAPGCSVLSCSCTSFTPSSSLDSQHIWSSTLYSPTAAFAVWLPGTGSITAGKVNLLPVRAVRGGP